jgi:hypothetical protein
MAAQVLLAGLLAASALAAASAPTPTPVPRLTGGFGRPTAAMGSESGGKSRSVVTIKSESLPGGPESGKAAASRPTRPAPTALPFPDPSLTGGTEGEWRQTAAQARQRVAVARARAAALEAAQRQLAYAYSYEYADPNYSERVTRPALERTGVELAAARRELDAAEKELADLPEKARRAGAYPGWIRE